MADIFDIVLEILEDLSADELDRFKLHLTKPVLDGFTPIPKGKLGTNVTQLVQIMERSYKDQGSIDITLKILEKMNLRDLEDKLKQKSGPSPSQDQKPASSAGNTSLIGGRPSVSSPSSPYTPLGQDFFHKHKAALEARLGSKITILSELERLGVLNTEEREEVKSNESRIKQNRTLLLMLENKGGTAQEKFYRVLKKCDGCLVEDLEGPYDYGT